MLMATTRPPVGGTPLSASFSCDTSRIASIPLVKIVLPSVAQPVCNPPMQLGRASIRRSGSGESGYVGGPV